MLHDLELFNQIAKKLFESEIEQPVTPFTDAADVRSKIDVALNDNAQDDDAFNKAVTDLVLNTPKTASKKFFNQLFGGRQGKAVLGDLLAVLLNNSMYTYKVAGPQVIVEKEIINKVCDLVGYGANASGTLAGGGSMCNLMAMLMARDKADTKSRFEGMSQKLIAYTSKESHYSITKNAAIIGIGRDNVRLIEADDNGKMSTSKLEEQIQEDISNGYSPFFINTTAGTTVLGEFDPIDETSSIASKYNLWLHVDGAYCGGVIFSKKYNYLVNGANKADSFCFNAHKMLGTPLSCSIIVVKDKQHLYQSLSNDASYLYQTNDDDYDLGQISLQCGRRNDALKLWTLWKSIGTNGLEKMVDHLFYLSDVAREHINGNSDYQLYSREDSTSICFNYKGIDAKQLCTELYKSSKLMVGYGSFREDTFVRLVMVSTNNSKQDILDFFKDLESFVAENEHIFSTQTVTSES